MQFSNVFQLHVQWTLTLNEAWLLLLGIDQYCTIEKGVIIIMGIFQINVEVLGCPWHYLVGIWFFRIW